MGERYTEVSAAVSGCVLFLSIVTIWGGGTLLAINGGRERRSHASHYTLMVPLYGTVMGQCHFLG